ncbi:MAG: hypothetical protein ABL993_10020 [Vicinamibacterales bacterium]
MPFLRVIRDKRGYETTYLMHWFRDGNRQYSRILYVFRSPSGVRVGRPALEPDVLRQIEAQHPQIEFDWKAVLDNRQVIEPPPEDRRPRKRRREDGESPPALDAGPRAAGQPRPSQTPAAPSVAEPRLVVPATIEGATPDEQVAFLAKWHAVLTERIPKRTADAERQAALLALAARLDPAGWTDADQITAGLLQAAGALERLSYVFAKRRRRARKSGRRPGSAEPAASPEGSAEPDSE